MRQIGLAENISRVVVVAVALKDAARFGELGQMPVMQIRGFFPAQGISLARQPDRGSDHLLERQLSIFLFGINHARDRPRHANGLVTDFAGARNHVALGVQIHVAGCGRGSHFAIVEKVRLAIRHANKHEPAATDISGCGMHHGQREPSGHGGVDGIASSLHDFHADTRRQFVDADHDRVRGMNGVHRRGGGNRHQQRQKQ